MVRWISNTRFFVFFKKLFFGTEKKDGRILPSSRLGSKEIGLQEKGKSHIILIDDYYHV